MKDASLRQLSTLWNKIAFLIGLRIENNEQAHTEHQNNILALTSYVQHEYPNLTIEELERAYVMGVKSELGDLKVFPLLNPLQVSGIITKFLSYKQIQLKPVTNSSVFEPPPLPPPTKEELDEIHLKMLSNAFFSVSNGNPYQDWGSVLYDALDAKGLVYFSNEEKYRFLELAKGDVIREQEQKVQDSLHTILYKNAINTLDTLKSGNFDSLNLKARAKNLALNALIFEQIQMQWTADEFWNSKNE